MLLEAAIIVILIITHAGAFFAGLRTKAGQDIASKIEEVVNRVEQLAKTKVDVEPGKAQVSNTISRIG